MTVNAAAFDVVAALVLAGALVTVAAPSLVHGTAALAATLLGVGVLFVVSGADLVGAVELLVGAVLIPLLLLVAQGRAGARRPTPLASTWPLAALVAALAGAGIMAAGLASRGELRSADWPSLLADDGAARTVARTLLTQDALPLAVAGLVVLTAALGAVALGRTDERELELELAERHRREREERVRRRREDRLRARGRSEAGSGEDAGS